MTVTAVPRHLTAAVERAREDVCSRHAELLRWGLVTWTAGNVSARVRDDESGSDLAVIKPSGLGYDELTPASMVVVDLTGAVIEGPLTPSSDTSSHLYVYREMPEVGGVVHTHSPYATAWAARSEPIPCTITAMGDEFGADIPVGPFALIGGEAIGEGIVATLRGQRSPAVLMARHGVFTVGGTARAAVKAAVMCEDVARTVHLARQLGPVERLPQDAVDQLYDRYQNVYGQR